MIHKTKINGSLQNDYYPHDDVTKWKHFPRYWPFMRGIHRSSVNSPHKGQWRVALMFSLICASTNGWAKPSRRRWFVTPSSSFWHHCYVQIVHMYYDSHDDRVPICEIYLFQALKLTALTKLYCANPYYNTLTDCKVFRPPYLFVPTVYKQILNERLH